jgi:hypothetical protein
MVPPMNVYANIDELEKLLVKNWTAFISPQRLIALVLASVRNADLSRVQNAPGIKNKNVTRVTLSQFRPAKDRSFTLWADFSVAQEKGLAVGTCELKFDPFSGSISNLQTVGNFFPTDE